jgi:hypothetical protein
MRAILKSEAGFGIIQAAFVATVLMTVAFFASDALQGQKKRSKLRRQNSKYQALVDHLQHQLNDPYICTAALGGKILPITSLNSWREVSIALSYGNEPGPIAANWEAKISDYKLKSVQIAATAVSMQTRYDGSAVPRMVIYDWPQKPPTPNAFAKYRASIRILPDDAHWNLNTEGDVDLLMAVNPASGVIYQCFGEASPAEACEKLGGAYDLSNGSTNDQRCNPDLNCVNHSVGLVDDPNLCSAPYSPNPLGYLDGVYKYVCTWCNRNRVGTPP